MRKILFLFGTLNDHDVEWMVSAGRVRSVPAGDVLVTQGHEIEAVYIILDGVFAVSVNAQLAQREISRMYAGDVVGELSFVDSRPPSATVTAIHHSRVLCISRVDLRGKLEEPGFASRFYRALALFLADRLRSTTAHVAYGPLDAGDEPLGAAAEIDPMVLEAVTLAGARFEHLLRQVRTH